VVVRMLIDSLLVNSYLHDAMVQNGTAAHTSCIANQERNLYSST
jgi:hypothetical protein